MGPAILFCPADRPDRFEKAQDRADAVILDLEDAVAAPDKPKAREAVAGSTLRPETTIVRVQSTSADGFADDLRAIASSPYRTVMLAKAESAADVAAVLAGVPDAAVVVLCETPLGVVRAEELAAHPSVVALMWGAEDLVAAMGGSSSRTESGEYRDVARHARSRVLLAAHAFGKAAIDSVRVDIADLDGARAEAQDASASGFSSKAAIHPNHVAPYREGFQPTPAEVDQAQRILAAAEGQPGAFSFEGRMIDEPILRHATSVLRRTTPTTNGAQG